MTTPYPGWTCGKCSAPVSGPYDTCPNCGFKPERNQKETTLLDIPSAITYMGNMSRSKFYADIAPCLEIVKSGHRTFITKESIDKFISDHIQKSPRPKPTPKPPLPRPQSSTLPTSLQLAIHNLYWDEVWPEIQDAQIDEETTGEEFVLNMLEIIPEIQEDGTITLYTNGYTQTIKTPFSIAEAIQNTIEGGAHGDGTYDDETHEELSKWRNTLNHALSLIAEVYKDKDKDKQ